MVPIKVGLDNGAREVEAKLYQFGSDKYLEIGDLADFFDADIKWLSVSKKVTMTFGGHRLEFSFFASSVRVDETKLKMTSPCHLDGGDLYVPLNFVISKSFTRSIGKVVKWDKGTKILSFYDFPNILNLKAQKKENDRKLVLETKQKLYYEVNKTDANKITVDIYKGVLDPSAQYAPANDSLITGLKFKQDINKVQWDIEVCPEFEYNVSTAAKPWRIIVEIRKTGGAVCPPQPEIVAADTTTVVMASPPIVPSLTVVPTSTLEIVEAPPPAVFKGPRIKTIVIDAGHGGRDPGAVGPRGTKEKDINLDLAFRLAQLLHDKTDLQVILTRKDDEFIPLAERTQIANEKKADLFICIHCNSGLERDSRGFEIYFLSDRATDEEAEAVANIENSVIDLEPKSTADDKLKAILWSLTLNEFVNDSSLLSSLIDNQVNEQEFSIVNRGVKQAGFFVLRGAKMPAVLVECAFVSNQREEKLLHKDSFCDKMTLAIYNGIMDYITRKEEQHAQQ